MLKINTVLLTTVILSYTGKYYIDVTAEDDFPASKQCMSCICDAISSCDTKSNCTSNKACGPFRIMYEDWTDGGRPTVNGEPHDSSTAFSNCARDTYCSYRSLQGYLRRFKQDCNGDGRIDCDDFAAIHGFGGYACKVVPLPGIYGKRYYRCKARFGATL